MLEAITPLTPRHCEASAAQVEVAETPLTKLAIRPGEKLPFMRLILPGGDSYSIKNSRGILMAAASWLIKSGKIAGRDIPAEPDKSKEKIHKK